MLIQGNVSKDLDCEAGVSLGNIISDYDCEAGVNVGNVTVIPCSYQLPPPFELYGWCVKLPATGAGVCSTTTASDTLIANITSLDDPDSFYSVKLRIRSILETRPYTGGVVDGEWYLGGEPTGSSWNTYSIVVSEPYQLIWLNNGTQVGCGDETSLALKDYEKSVIMKGNASLRLQCLSIDGNQSNNVSRLVLNNDTLRPMVISQPYHGEFFQVDTLTSDVVGTACTSVTKITPNMTSNTLPSGIVSASSFTLGKEPWKAFDGVNTNTDANSYWLPSSGTQWIQYQFSSAKTVDKYTISSPNPNRIGTITLEGSNNGTTWTQVDYRGNLGLFSTWSPHQVRSFYVRNCPAFSYWRFTFVPVPSPGVQISEIGLFSC